MSACNSCVVAGLHIWKLCISMSKSTVGSLFSTFDNANLDI